MRGSSLLPKQLLSLGGPESWLNRRATSCLLSTARLACQHPIHTLVVIALLASTSYVGLLQESLFDAATLSENGRVDATRLLEGGRTLELSDNTAWRWQIREDPPPETSNKVRLLPTTTGSFTNERQPSQHLALATFIFPRSSISQLAPPAQAVPIPQNVTALNVPSTANLLSPISDDSSLAFSTSWTEIQDFLQGAQEIPGGYLDRQIQEQTWVMKAARHNNGATRSYSAWLQDGWTSFVDLIKVGGQDLAFMAAC